MCMVYFLSVLDQSWSPIYEFSGYKLQPRTFAICDNKNIPVFHFLNLSWIKLGQIFFEAFKNINWS